LQTELHTDGSNVGIGATLIQIDNEKEKIICYYSRVLSTAEKHYSAIEIELLAIIDGIKRFKHYLIGRKFKIVTDSNPLTYLMRTKNLNSRLSHWSMFLQEYDFEIVYRKGSENKLCDYLSRYPNKEPENEELKLNLFLCEFDFPQINENENFLFDSFLTQLNDISKLQREDKYFSHIIDILNGNTKNKSKSLRRAANNYEIVNGKLYRVIVHNNQFKNLLVIPKCLVPQILQGVHDLTKAVKNITAKDVAKFLMHRIILQYSAFDTLISDNGVQFRSNIIAELNNLLKSNHKFTTPYHPSSSGQVERCNQQIIQLLRTFIEKEINDWDVILPYITHIYNTSLHASTNFNPFFLTRGYHAKLPIDFIFENEFNEPKDDLVYEIAYNLTKARDLAKQNILKSQNAFKKQYDKNKLNYEFEVGDKCLISYPISNMMQKNKFKPKWL
ncbi:uncharacterized protein B4U79_00636, partial [Dinothrombium tinctorium]